jgi:hypothetical protein
MRTFGPTSTPLTPMADPVIASVAVIDTAAADGVAGPTTIYTVPADGLYRISVAGQTFNSDTVASGGLTVSVDLTCAGGVSIPINQSLGLTGDANDQIVTCRNLAAGSTIDLTLIISSFSGTSCDYAVRIGIERLI